MRAHFERRIGYLEEGIQDVLRHELEALLSDALLSIPEADTDVAHDELLVWLHQRAWCVHRGGNNILGLSNAFCSAVSEESDARLGRMQGTESRSHEHILKDTLAKIAQAMAEMEHKVSDWIDQLVAERHRRVVRMVQADIEQRFNHRVAELRTTLVVQPT